MFLVFKWNASEKNTEREIFRVELSCHLENIEIAVSEPSTRYCVNNIVLLTKNRSDSKFQNQGEILTSYFFKFVNYA